jgi:hypothetical protein
VGGLSLGPKLGLPKRFWPPKVFLLSPGLSESQIQYKEINKPKQGIKTLGLKTENIHICND